MACTQPRPEEGHVRALVEELYAHAADMHAGNRWEVGAAGTGITEAESKQDEERWPRHDPGDAQTYYPGELVTQDESDDEGNGEEDAAEDQRAETGTEEGGAG
eukprot:2793525-Prymnesium_polylepis.1